MADDIIPPIEVRLVFVSDDAALTRAKAQMAEFGALSESSLGGVSRDMDKAASDAEKSSGRISSAFSKAGNTLGNWGIPFSGSLTKMSTAMDSAESKGKSFVATMSAIGGTTLTVGAVGMAAVSAEALHLGANFQKSMTQLVTTAGESQAGMKVVSSGLLNMAGAVGTTAQQLATGMYTVESAGYHGAAGLAVIKPAAEAAKAESADLGDVTNAVTSALNAYGLSGKDATSVTNQLLTTVSEGKMHFQDLVSSLGNVLPVAAAAHVSLAQVGGAIATMTSQGFSADRATQDLANTIRSLQSPSQTAQSEMEQLGLRSNDVAKNLGTRGLTGTLDLLVQTITSKMGPSGEVILNAFKQSQDASKDLQTMLGAMPPSVRKLADEFMSGSLTMSQFRKQVPTNDMGMLSQFQALYNKVNGFNDALKSGQPGAQTFTKALQTMLGGATGLNTALLLTGGHAATFSENVKKVGDAGKKTGSNIENWSLVQKNFSFQLDQAKAGVEALGTRLGLALIPKVQDLIHYASEAADWLTKNKGAAEGLAIVIGGTLSAAVATFTYTHLANMAKTIGGMVGSVANLGKALLGIPSSVAPTGLGGTTGETPVVSGGGGGTTTLYSAAETLQSAGLSLQTAAEKLGASGADLTTAATDQETAATEQETAAGKQGLGGLAGGAAGAGRTTEEAAGIGTASRVGTAIASSALGPVVGAAGIYGVGYGAIKLAAPTGGVTSTGAGQSIFEHYALGGRPTVGGHPVVSPNELAVAQAAAVAALKAQPKGTVPGQTGYEYVAPAYEGTGRTVGGGVVHPQGPLSKIPASQLGHETDAATRALDKSTRESKAADALSAAAKLLGPAATAYQHMMKTGGQMKNQVETPEAKAWYKILNQISSLTQQAKGGTGAQAAQASAISSAAFSGKTGNVGQLSTDIQKLQADQKQLTKDGTLKQSNTLLHSLQGKLATEQSSHASMTAIQQTKSEITAVRQHITELNSAAKALAKAKDVEKNGGDIVGAIRDLKTTLQSIMKGLGNQTVINMNGPVQAANPQSFVAGMQQRARVAALSHNTMNGPNLSAAS